MSFFDLDRFTPEVLGVLTILLYLRSLWRRRSKSRGAPANEADTKERRSILDDAHEALGALHLVVLPVVLVVLIVLAFTEPLIAWILTGTAATMLVLYGIGRILRPRAPSQSDCDKIEPR